MADHPQCACGADRPALESYSPREWECLWCGRFYQLGGKQKDIDAAYMARTNKFSHQPLRRANG